MKITFFSLYNVVQYVSKYCIYAIMYKNAHHYRV
jgi:hypothetical protein